MSAKENKALVRRYVEEFVDRGNFDLQDEIFAPNFVRYEASSDQVTSVEDLKHFFGVLHSGFPGFQSTIEDLLSEGDKVVLRFTFRGTHQAEFLDDAFARYRSGTARLAGTFREGVSETGRTATGLLGAATGAVADATGRAVETTASGAEQAAEAVAFPIEGYDEMNVEEISGRLEGLSVEELQVVRDYEELNEGRKTLLDQMDRKIRSASSAWEGPDDNL